MRFSITGVNHKSAPVEVRERLAFDDHALALEGDSFEDVGKLSACFGGG